MFLVLRGWDLACMLTSAVLHLGYTVTDYTDWKALSKSKSNRRASGEATPFNSPTHDKTKHQGQETDVRNKKSKLSADIPVCFWW